MSLRACAWPQSWPMCTRHDPHVSTVFFRAITSSSSRPIRFHCSYLVELLLLFLTFSALADLLHRPRLFHSITSLVRYNAPSLRTSGASGAKVRQKLSSSRIHVLAAELFMYGHTYIKGMDQPGKVSNPGRGQLNRGKDIPLSAFVPENLVSRDGFGSPVPRQPAHSPYATGSVPSLPISGHAVAYRWRELTRLNSTAQ